MNGIHMSGRDIAYERTCQGKSFNIKIEPIK